MSKIRLTVCRRLVPAIFGAVVAGAGAGAVVANAGPVWDIDDFDSCTELLDDGINESLQQKLDETEYCCTHTGGVWNEAQQVCQAPPAEGAEATGPTQPIRPLSPILEETKVPAAAPTSTTVRPLPTLPDGPILPPMGAG
jgi:hypothetical protein